MGMVERMRGIGPWLLALCLPFGLAMDAQSRAPDLIASFVGTWKAPVERTERASPVDEEVFGPGAVDVRNVSLTLEPTGEGHLQISTSVVDRGGHLHVPSIVDVKFAASGPLTPAPGGDQPAIKIISAEERFLEGAGERFPMEDVRVTMTLPSPAKGTLELSFDTRDGRGAFGTTMRRQYPVGQTTRSRQGPSKAAD
jgi:hypothetical protein